VFENELECYLLLLLEIYSLGDMSLDDISSRHGILYKLNIFFPFHESTDHFFSLGW